MVQRRLGALFLVTLLASLLTPGTALAAEYVQGRTYDKTMYGVAGGLRVLRRELSSGQEYDLKIGAKTSGKAHYGYLTIRSLPASTARWYWQTVFDGTLAELPLNYESDNYRFVRLSGNSNNTVTLYHGSSSGPTTVSYTNPTFETVLVRSYARLDSMFIGDTNTGNLYYQYVRDNPSALYAWNAPTRIARSSDRVCGILDPSYVFSYSHNNGQTCGGAIVT
jgi:hypothetical protein